MSHHHHYPNHHLLNHRYHLNNHHKGHYHYQNKQIHYCLPNLHHPLHRHYHHQHHRHHQACLHHSSIGLNWEYPHSYQHHHWQHRNHKLNRHLYHANLYLILFLLHNILSSNQLRQRPLHHHYNQTPNAELNQYADLKHARQELSAIRSHLQQCNVLELVYHHYHHNNLRQKYTIGEFVH